MVFEYLSDASAIASRRPVLKNRVRQLRRKGTFAYKCQTSGTFYFVVREQEGMRVPFSNPEVTGPVT